MHKTAYSRPEYRILARLARPYYPYDGPNSWQKQTKKASDEVYLGTTNPGKIKEMTELLASLGIKARQLENIPDVPETARSYKGNATLKAETLSRQFGVPVLSEDSGLGVRALHGAPGLYSGRFSGATDHNSKMNAEKLLEVMKNEPDRRAAFITAAALCANGKTFSVTRRKPGTISTEPRGDKGFSYDTVFIPEGSDQTYAETGDKSDSSRNRAVIALIKKLREQGVLRNA